MKDVLLRDARNLKNRLIVVFHHRPSYVIRGRGCLLEDQDGISSPTLLLIGRSCKTWPDVNLTYISPSQTKHTLKKVVDQRLSFTKKRRGAHILSSSFKLHNFANSIHDFVRVNWFEPPSWRVMWINTGR